MYVMYVSRRGAAKDRRSPIRAAIQLVAGVRALYNPLTVRSSTAACRRRRAMDAAAEGGLFVPARGRRFQQQGRVLGAMPFTLEGSPSDTGGRLLVIEQDNAYPGGPPRHVHHEQEEWFCAVQGTYVVEIGGEAHRLTAGSSVLAPRGVPHSW